MCACGKSAEPEFQFGTVKNNEYQNSFLNIGAKFPPDWSFLSEEKIREQNNITKDMLGDDYKSLIESAATLQDAWAVRDNIGDNLNIVLERVNPITKKLSTEEYLSSAIDTTIPALNSMGAVNLSFDIGDIKFAGESSSCMSISGAFQGIPIYESIVCLRRGNYFCLITAFSFSEDSIRDMLDYFYKLEK